MTDKMSHKERLIAGNVTDLRDNHTIETLPDGRIKVHAIDETKKFKFNKIILFVEEYNPETVVLREVLFETKEELLGIPEIAKYNKAKDFSHFSIKDNLLVANFNKYYYNVAVGYIHWNVKFEL